MQGTYSRNAPEGDWNTGEWWTIDPSAGGDATGENHIDWTQWLGPAPILLVFAEFDGWRPQVRGHEGIPAIPGGSPLHAAKLGGIGRVAATFAKGRAHVEGLGQRVRAHHRNPVAVLDGNKSRKGCVFLSQVVAI